MGYVIASGRYTAVSRPGYDLYFRREKTLVSFLSADGVLLLIARWCCVVTLPLLTFSATATCAVETIDLSRAAVFVSPDSIIHRGLPCRINFRDQAIAPFLAGQDRNLLRCGCRC